MEIVDQSSSFVSKVLNFIENNKVLNTVVSMLLILYVIFAAPKLPRSVVKVFDHSLFKLGYMFLIAYIATKNPTVAIISSVALLVTIQTLSSYEAAHKAVRVARVSENFSDSSNVVDNVSIPLSPTRAEFIDSCAKAADLHYKEAHKAEQNGDIELANAHKEMAVKKEIMIEGSVKEKQHLLAAEQAEQNGDHAVAEAHKEEAEKQEMKVDALVKAEAHMEEANKAVQEGRIEDAQALKEEAKKEEDVAKALINEESVVPEVVHTAKPEGSSSEPVPMEEVVSELSMAPVAETNSALPNVPLVEQRQVANASTVSCNNGNSNVDGYLNMDSYATY